MKLKPIASNQTELTTTEGAVILFSYETPVAAMLPSGQYARTSDWYSHTTTRHINKWLQGVTADVLEHPEEWFRNLVEIRYREPEAPASEHEEEQRATHSYGWDCGEWEARAGGAP